MTRPLLDLLSCGQSYWLDNLTRKMIRSGELKRRVLQECLRGLTSNPAIFHKAIVGSADYDAQLQALTQDRHPVVEIYYAMAISDIQAACDILHPVYVQSHGVDGFVSLEVSPHHAHDADSSIEEARELHAAVARPNLLIKIPGSPSGLPAIEELLFEGINVNVTLLFSIDSYESVAWAYVRALERRLEKGLPIDGIASVASFFLSRIDTLVDQRLQMRVQEGEPRAAELLGKAAVANAKLAYQRFKAICATDRWRALAARGAHVQRMLWASTSTKNPAYRDVMYVEPLIGPDTVNTMPEETIAAFADHGTVRVTIEEDLDEAFRVLQDLAAVGIDFKDVTDHLLREGVQKFTEPYDALLASIEEKRQAFARRGYRPQPSPPGMR